MKNANFPITNLANRSRGQGLSELAKLLPNVSD